MRTLLQPSRFSWRHIVIFLSVLAISASVATRTFHTACLNDATVQDGSSNAKHQHLDTDAFALNDPVPQLAMVLPVAAPHAPPPEPQYRTVEFIELLSNRPPPSLSLL